jgi:MFS family permease
MRAMGPEALRVQRVYLLLTLLSTLAASFIWGINTLFLQTLLNGMVPSAHRATVLSFDNMMTSAGGVLAQPALGRVADVSGYAAAYVVCAAIQVTAIPFLALTRREKPAGDPIDAEV